MSRVRLVITSPLPDELVARIRATDARLDVVHEPDLLAPARHACDHPPPKVDDPAARERWNALLDEAEVLFDFGPLELAPSLAERPQLRWIQATSAGVGKLAERVGLTKSSVAVTTASGVHARPLAEFVLLAMLMFGKDGLRLGREQREHHWELYCGEETGGKTIKGRFTLKETSARSGAKWRGSHVRSTPASSEPCVSCVTARPKTSVSSVSSRPTGSTSCCRMPTSSCLPSRTPR